MRILLAEDEANLGEALRAGLRMMGFQVDWVRDGVAALREILMGQHAAVVLDIGLPRSSGLEVLHQLRAQRKTMPVLMLTARDGNEDITQALNAGADDFVVKPVDIEVLAARLRALIRRSSGHAENVLSWEGLRLDPVSRNVWLNDQLLTLSAREFDLLSVLMQANGRIVTRDYLCQHMYEWGQEVQSNAVDVHMHNLRKKLGPQGKSWLASVRGMGYHMQKSAAEH